MKIEFETHPAWDLTVMGIFIGAICLLPDDFPNRKEVRKLAQANWRKYYKALTLEQKVSLQDEIAAMKSSTPADLSAAMKEFFNDAVDDADLDKIKTFGQ